MDGNLIEIFTGLGGGAAITTVAWYLLFTVWKRFEVTNSERIAELIQRAQQCEADRAELRTDIHDLSLKLHDVQVKQMSRLITALDRNTEQMEKTREA